VPALRPGVRALARRRTARGAGAGSEIYGLAFAPDGARLAAAHNDSTVSVWDVASGEQVHDFFVRDASAMGLTYSPDGRCLATAQADGAVYLWDAATARRLARLTGHTGEVIAVAFSPAGDVLASGGRDGTAILWR
jgi:WD40 repeat protein